MPDTEWVRLTAEGRDKHWGVFHYRRAIEGGTFDHTLRWMNPPHRFEVFTHLTTAELAAIPAVKALVEAARMLARSAALSDRELDVVRQEWGNTNVEVLRHWRDRTLDALAALGTPATPEVDDG